MTHHTSSHTPSPTGLHACLATFLIKTETEFHIFQTLMAIRKVHNTTYPSLHTLTPTHPLPPTPTDLHSSSAMSLMKTDTECNTLPTLKA